jgi:hypothetical protein
MAERQFIRCSDGHLYTASWVPGFSWRSARLGFGKRFDRCPIDHRWRMAQIVDPGELSEADIAQAEEHYSGVR